VKKYKPISILLAAASRTFLTKYGSICKVPSVPQPLYPALIIAKSTCPEALTAPQSIFPCH